MDNKRKAVVACIDGSTYSDSVVDYAAWIARTVGAPLQLLHNIERRHSPVAVDLSGNIGLGSREDLLEELVALEERRSKILLEQGRAMLDRAAKRAIEASVSEPIKLQRHGSLTDSLIDMEEEIRVLVMGIRGENHENHSDRIGEQLEGIIRALHRPVLVVNQPFSGAPSRCMIDYDGSEGANKALHMVATSPLYRGMKCHLVHVTREVKSPLLSEASRVLQDAGINVVATSLQGDVEMQLREYHQQHQIELTVMGAFGHSRLREMLFGSLTHHMLTHSKMPLLLLR